MASRREPAGFAGRLGGHRVNERSPTIPERHCHFAASEIPFQYHPEDNSPPETPLAGSYAYLPITAGATTFMYNLRINGQRVTNLRLSGLNLAKIFTGVIANWNDAALAVDNPGLTLPSKTIVPVVRSDGGAGTTYQLSGWISSQFPDVWNAYAPGWAGKRPAGRRPSTRRSPE